PETTCIGSDPSRHCPAFIVKNDSIKILCQFKIMSRDKSLRYDSRTSVINLAIPATRLSVTLISDRKPKLRLMEDIISIRLIYSPSFSEDLIASYITIPITDTCFKSSFHPVSKSFATPNASAEDMEIVCRSSSLNLILVHSLYCQLYKLSRFKYKIYSNLTKL